MSAYGRSKRKPLWPISWLLEVMLIFYFLFLLLIFLFLWYSKAPDGKSIVHFCVEFNTNGTHLPNLTKAIALGTLGKLTPVPVAPKLDQAGG